MPSYNPALPGSFAQKIGRPGWGLLLAVLAGLQPLGLAQAPSTSSAQPLSTAELRSTKAETQQADAYYHYTLGHMYEELAAANNSRTDYVNQAIENFQLAIKEDPSAAFLVQDVAELYRTSGRTREAVEQAQAAIKANPNDLNAHRVLARIYTQQIGDSQANRVNEDMVKRALDEYKLITTRDPKDADSLVMTGRLERVLNDSVNAEAAYKKAIEVDPDNDDAVTGLAGLYSDRGDARAASALLEKAASKRPSARSFTNLANAYESMHEYALAADTYSKALAQDPSRSDLKEAQAQDLALAGRFDEALKTYQELSDLDPKSSKPYLGESQIYREQKNYSKARESLNKAKELDPDNLEIRYSEVGLLENEGKLAEATAALKGILDSTSRRSYDTAQKGFRARLEEQLGLLYRNNEQYPESIEAFRQIEPLTPEAAPRAEAQIASTYMAAHNDAKAISVLDAAIAKYPGERTLHEVRAQVLSDQGKPDEAVAELKKLLDGKSDREIYVAIADVYGKARNFTAMGAAIDQADKLSKTKEEKSAVLFLRGTMQERQKNYDGAEKSFRQVLDLDETNASAMNYLGYMLADRNQRLSEAQRLILRAVELEPTNYAFLDSLGWVYYRMNKLEAAEQQLLRSVQLFSKDPTIHDHLGDVYLKEGRVREAVAQWQSSLKAYSAGSSADAEPEDVSKVQHKLDNARVRLAKEQRPRTP